MKPISLVRRLGSHNCFFQRTGNKLPIKDCADDHLCEIRSSKSLVCPHLAQNILGDFIFCHLKLSYELIERIENLCMTHKNIHTKWCMFKVSDRHRCSHKLKLQKHQDNDTAHRKLPQNPQDADTCAQSIEPCLRTPPGHITVDYTSVRDYRLQKRVYGIIIRLFQTH